MDVNIHIDDLALQTTGDTEEEVAELQAVGAKELHCELAELQFAIALGKVQAPSLSWQSTHDPLLRSDTFSVVFTSFKNRAYVEHPHYHVRI